MTDKPLPKGWTEGTVQELLGLTDEEVAMTDKPLDSSASCDTDKIRRRHRPIEGRELTELCDCCHDAIRLADEVDRSNEIIDQLSAQWHETLAEIDRLREALSKIDDYSGVSADTPRAIRARGDSDD